MTLTIHQAITAHQEGKLNEAEYLYKKLLEADPKLSSIHYNLGLLLQSLNRLDEAEASYKKAIEFKSDYSEAYNNLAITLDKLERLDEAEASYKKAIEFKSDYNEAYNNLGITYNNLNRFKDAEKSYKKAIELKPDYADAYNNLGITLDKLGRLEDAEVSYKKAIKLKPDFADAYSNLGAIFQKLNKLDEAEASYKKTIELKPDYIIAYINLGSALKRLHRLDEAEVVYNKVLEFKCDDFNTYNNLGVALSELERFEEAEVSYKKAIELKPNFAQAHHNLRNTIKINKLLKIQKTIKPGKKNSATRLTSDPFISNRDVDVKLLSYLYKMNSIELYKLKDNLFGKQAARYGNGKCSENFHLFDNDSITIKTVEKDLINIMSEAVKSDVFVIDSFFNILNAGSGTIPHGHTDTFDEARGLDKHKYSLVYYLSVGDQKCSEPGILKLYDPDEEILPSEGMIVIIPADRLHSAVYDGKLDRVMIGVNFYSLL